MGDWHPYCQEILYCGHCASGSSLNNGLHSIEIDVSSNLLNWWSAMTPVHFISCIMNLGPPVLLLRHGAVARILANGDAAFFESCAAIGWKDCEASCGCSRTGPKFKLSPLLISLWGIFSTPGILVDAFCVNGVVDCRLGAAPGCQWRYYNLIGCRMRMRCWMWFVSLWLWRPTIELMHRFHLGDSSGTGAIMIAPVSVLNLSGADRFQTQRPQRSSTRVCDLLYKLCTVLVYCIYYRFCISSGIKAFLLTHTPHCLEWVRIMFMNRPWMIHAWIFITHSCIVRPHNTYLNHVTS